MLSLHCTALTVVSGECEVRLGTPVRLFATSVQQTLSVESDGARAVECANTVLRLH